MKGASLLDHKHDYMLATLPKSRHEIESTEDSTRVVGIYARRGKQSCQPARAASSCASAPLLVQLKPTT